MDITHDNVCSSMLSCFYSHLLSTGRPISSFNLFLVCTGFVPVSESYLQMTCSLHVILQGTVAALQFGRKFGFGEVGLLDGFD